MSIKGYSISKGKTKFQIHLSSTQSNNWSGVSDYDARYNVDLRNHIDVSDMNKAYNLYVNFRSNPSSEPNPADLFALHLDIGNNMINAHSFRENATPHLILKCELVANVVSTDLYSVYCDSTFNSPLYVKTLYNVDVIGVNLLKINPVQTVPWSATEYHMILHFEEV